jgi:hypothetical protein
MATAGRRAHWRWASGQLRARFLTVGAPRGTGDRGDPHHGVAGCWGGAIWSGNGRPRCWPEFLDERALEVQRCGEEGSGGCGVERRRWGAFYRGGQAVVGKGDGRPSGGQRCAIKAAVTRRGGDGAATIHGGIEEESMACRFSSIRVWEGSTRQRMARRRLGHPKEGDDPRVGVTPQNSEFCNVTKIH